MDKCLHFRDLVDLGVVSNRVTLQRWIKHEGFPPGLLIGANTRIWSETEIKDWLDSRPVDKAQRRQA